MTTTTRVTKTTKIGFRIEVEGAPQVDVAGWVGGAITFDPTYISGEWVENWYPENRYVVVRGVSKFGPLEQEFALDPERTMKLRPLAPDWVLEVLEEAGIDY